LYNKELHEVVEESRPQLYKDLKMELVEFFENSDLDEFYATAKDIKEKFYSHNNNIDLSYIRFILKNEFDMNPPEDPFRYDPFGGKVIQKPNGRAYKFERIDFKISKRDGAPF
jgi:hypothetical protein